MNIPARVQSIVIQIHVEILSANYRKLVNFVRIVIRIVMEEVVIMTRALDFVQNVRMQIVEMEFVVKLNTMVHAPWIVMIPVEMARVKYGKIL